MKRGIAPGLGLAALTVVILGWNYTADAQGNQWGNVKGRIVWGGKDIPKQQPIAAVANSPDKASCLMDGHVVVDDYRLHINALGPCQISGHFKIHDVAGVILYNVKNTFASVDRFRRFEHLVRCWTRKYGTGTSGIEHSAAHETAVHGLVTAATPGNECDLILYRSVCTYDKIRVCVDFNQITERGPKAGHGFENDVLG